MTGIFQRLRTRFERGKGFGRRRAAGANGHAVAHRTADHFTMDIGRNDELAAHPGECIDLFRFSTVPAPINALSPYASTMAGMLCSH